MGQAKPEVLREIMEMEREGSSLKEAMREICEEYGVDYQRYRNVVEKQ